MPVARRAGPDDLATLAALAAEAIDEKRDQRGGAVWASREARQDPIVDSFAAALASPDHLVLTGEYAGAVVGYAAAHVEALRDGSLLGVIDDLFVLEDGRGVGLGEALMGDVIAWCEGRGCSGVDALALPGDRETKNFFEANGLVARAIVVHRDLAGGGAGSRASHGERSDAPVAP